MINNVNNNYIGLFYAQIEGYSMVPLINNGDKIIAQKNSNYAVGDIIIFKNCHKFVCHRIICIKGEHYICKGDNWNTIEIIDFEKIYGKVIKIISLEKEISLRQFEINKKIISYYSFMIYKLSIIENLNMSQIRKTEIYNKMINLIKYK